MTSPKPDPAAVSIAYFVSPHGYGHAARAAAVMAAMADIVPAVRFEIFTRTPRWFFEDSLTEPFGYHSVLTDIGLVQKTSLVENLPGTVDRLNEFLPFDSSLVARLAGLVNRLACRLVICDIAPLGIAAARQAGIPAVLVENFTWDWIYEGYEPNEPGLKPHIDYLRHIFSMADYHVQTEPVCHPQAVDLTTPPVSRQTKAPAGTVRQELGLPDSIKTVLLTMGGFSWQYTFLEALLSQDGIQFILPGAAEDFSRRRNLLLLPHRSGLYHPDLVNACDVVIGKLGYSTLAEVYQAGAPFGYITRPHFRESAPLAAYVEREMAGMAIDESHFEDGRWLETLPELLALPRPAYHRRAGGAGRLASFIRGLLGG